MPQVFALFLVSCSSLSMAWRICCGSNFWPSSIRYYLSCIEPVEKPFMGVSANRSILTSMHDHTMLGGERYCYPALMESVARQQIQCRFFKIVGPAWDDISTVNVDPRGIAQFGNLLRAFGKETVIMLTLCTLVNNQTLWARVPRALLSIKFPC